MKILRLFLLRPRLPALDLEILLRGVWDFSLGGPP
jgi:hypothetical protein